MGAEREQLLCRDHLGPAATIHDESRAQRGQERPGSSEIDVGLADQLCTIRVVDRERRTDESHRDCQRRQHRQPQPKAHRSLSVKPTPRTV